VVPRRMCQRRSQYPILLPRWRMCRRRQQHGSKSFRRDPVRLKKNRARLLAVQTPAPNRHGEEKKILIESCPISNEVLRYTASIMSHPLPALLSRGVPASLSNDDPALMGHDTSGMTHDFWQAIQGWENLGLAGLVSKAREFCE